MQLTYSTLVARLLDIVPELQPAYEAEKQFWDEEKPGAHIIFGDILTPYLISLLEKNSDPQALYRVFTLLEEMATHIDSRIQEVVAFSVCERLADHPRWVEAAEVYIGPKTRELLSQVRDFWGL